jgi:hypothetical protein
MRKANANIALKVASSAPTPPANSQDLRRRIRWSAALGSIETMPRIGRLLVSLSDRASWNVGMS